MADDIIDPREVPWHPRLAQNVVGHQDAFAFFANAIASGRPHHAWLMTGPLGIGKSTLAYAMARHALAQTMKPELVQRWMHARAHPDLVVLERTFNDAKPRKLRTEISVDDVRTFIDFFARTSSNGGWRVGIVDAADDLNSESANALLKLVEEPPAKTLIFLVCHAPGKLLRTLRSRCRKLPLASLTDVQTADVLIALPLDPAVPQPALMQAAAISGGSPGLALQLLHSEGAKAFQSFATAKRLDAPARQSIGQHFATRAAAQQDFEVLHGVALGMAGRKSKIGRVTLNLRNCTKALHSNRPSYRVTIWTAVPPSWKRYRKLIMP